MILSPGDRSVGEITFCGAADRERYAWTASEEYFRGDTSKTLSATHAHRIDCRRDAGVRTARSSVLRRPSAHGTSGAIQRHRNRNGWNSIESMKLVGVFGLRRKAIGRLLFPIDRYFSIDSGLKRWGREDLRSGSRLLPERRENFPDRSWFPQSSVERSKMLYLPGKVSLLARVKERGFSGAFLGFVLVTMAGSIFPKCVFWYFS